MKTPEILIDHKNYFLAYNLQTSKWHWRTKMTHMRYGSTFTLSHALTPSHFYTITLHSFVWVGWRVKLIGTKSQPKPKLP